VAGDRFRLEVKERERLGSPESRRLRKQGLVPGVLYGKSGAKPFIVKERDLRSALTGSSGLHAVLDVVLEGQTTPHSSILKEYQRDPIRGHVRHCGSTSRSRRPSTSTSTAPRKHRASRRAAFSRSRARR
jgi:large subunit ribosomal protein L25